MAPRFVAFLALALLALLVACGGYPVGQPTWLSSGAMGFGQGTRGGNPAVVCSAMDMESLAACATATVSSVVDLGGGTITTSAPIQVASDKTIQNGTISSPGDIFRATGVHNLIFRNLRLSSIAGVLWDHPIGGSLPELCPDPTDPSLVDDTLLDGCGIPLNLKGSATNSTTHVWIDHVSFSYCGFRCVNISNSGASPGGVGQYYGADLITISNSDFGSSFYAVDITMGGPEIRGPGGLADNAADCVANLARMAPQRVTVYRNHFHDVRRRAVRVAYCNGQAHQFNDVVENWGLAGFCASGSFGFGPSSTSSAQLALENEVLSANPVPGSCLLAVSIADGWSGFVRSSGHVLLNGAQDLQNSPSSVFVPPYAYRLMPASRVQGYVLANAGSPLP